MDSRLHVIRGAKPLLMALIGLAAGIFLLACQSALLNYRGSTLKPGATIPVLQGTVPVNQFVAPDVVIEYQYTRNGDALDLSGTAQYAPSIRNNFVVVPRFYMRAYFADAQGAILGYHGIVTSNYGYADDHMRFHERITVPPGTALMAFGYSGEARGTGSDDGAGGDTPFWYEPVAR